MSDQHLQLENPFDFFNEHLNNPAPVTIPKGSKLYFCRLSNFSRDFVRDQGLYKITYDPVKADFVVYNEFILAKAFCDNLNYMQPSRVLQVKSYQQSHIDDMVFQKKMNNKTLVGVMNVLKGNTIDITYEEYCITKQTIESNFNMGLLYLSKFDLSNRNNWYYITNIFKNLHLQIDNENRKDNNKYLSQVIYPFLMYYLRSLSRLADWNSKREDVDAYNFFWNDYYFNKNHKDDKSALWLYNKFKRNNWPICNKIVTLSLASLFVQHVSNFEYYDTIKIKDVIFSMDI